jgi:hypothetical protein
MENLTQHAKTRMQQRGIPQSALEHLLDYGRFQYDHRGAAVVFLDKAARRRRTAALGEARQWVEESAEFAQAPGACLMRKRICSVGPGDECAAFRRERLSLSGNS